MPEQVELRRKIGQRDELQRELQDARENNYYNALKLERSSDIANRVFETLKNRYQKD